jgi:ribosomal protein S27AE
VQLLADTEQEVSRLYDVIIEKIVNGATKACLQRCTFVIDKKGVVRHVMRELNRKSTWTKCSRCANSSTMAARIDRGTVVTLAYDLKDCDGGARRAGRRDGLPARLRRHLSQGREASRASAWATR